MNAATIQLIATFAAPIAVVWGAQLANNARLVRIEVKLILMDNKIERIYSNMDKLVE